MPAVQIANRQSAIANPMSLFQAPLDSIRNSQVWNAIFRHGVPRDRRTRVMAIMSNVFLHLHPVAVRKSGIRLSFTWCMGGLTFFLFLAEVVSGVLLMFYYRPTIGMEPMSPALAVGSAWRMSAAAPAT